MKKKIAVMVDKEVIKDFKIGAKAINSNATKEIESFMKRFNKNYRRNIEMAKNAGEMK